MKKFLKKRKTLVFSLRNFASGNLIQTLATIATAYPQTHGTIKNSKILVFSKTLCNWNLFTDDIKNSLCMWNFIEYSFLASGYCIFSWSCDNLEE